MEKVIRTNAVTPFEEVRRKLLEYHARSTAALTTGAISGRQAREFAATIEQIRLLLRELAPRTNQFRALSEQYEELEGLAKERRNDLCSAEDVRIA